MKRSTAARVRKAGGGWRSAVALGGRRPPVHNAVCFHYQQCAEKYLKALLEELDRPIPRTHILRDLLALLAPHHRSLLQFGRGLRFLTRFAVPPRSPYDDATKRRGDPARRWAGRVRDV